MIKKNKRLVLSLFAFLLTLIGGFVFGGCNSRTNLNITYINIVENFNLKFQTEKVIYVDDLDFETDTILNVNRSIKIVGKNTKSTISKLFLKITAPHVAGERIKIEFENIIFDGGFDKTDFDLTQQDTFENILLSNRDNKHCIMANIGHFDLNINNCEFTNYASQLGSVIRVDNSDKVSTEEKLICINNCRFYGNICQRGTIAISHDRAKTKITNCEFYENFGTVATGFNISNGWVLADNCVIKDNNFCSFNVEEKSGQWSGGGVHFGGVDGKLSNTKISNNEAIFGGGLSVASKNSGDSDFVIENCVIKNNSAIKNGGGVIIHSGTGQTVSFIGCEISFNNAPSSASVCSVPIGGWNPNSKSGNVNFYFCKIAMNEGLDNKGILTDLDFYVPLNPTKLPNASQNANTQIKGCIIIDETSLTENENDYNYIATQNQAEIDGVIDSALLTNSLEKELCLLENEKTNIVIPASVYSSWNMEFAGATKNANIGGYTRSINCINMILIVSLMAGIIIIFISVVMIVSKIKKKPILSQILPNNEEVLEDVKIVNLEKLYEVKKYEYREINGGVENAESISNVSFNQLEIEQIVANWDLVDTLSKKEKEVFVLRLSGKKRKDIAKKQFVSENTIKKQLIKIYSKLEVANGKELIEHARNYLNK